MGLDPDAQAGFGCGLLPMFAPGEELADHRAKSPNVAGDEAVDVVGRDAARRAATNHGDSGGEDALDRRSYGWQTLPEGADAALSGEYGTGYGGGQRRRHRVPDLRPALGHRPHERVVAGEAL